MELSRTDSKNSITRDHDDVMCQSSGTQIYDMGSETLATKQRRLYDPRWERIFVFVEIVSAYDILRAFCLSQLED